MNGFHMKTWLRWWGFQGPQEAGEMLWGNDSFKLPQVTYEQPLASSLVRKGSVLGPPEVLTHSRVLTCLVSWAPGPSPELICSSVLS